MGTKVRMQGISKEFDVFETALYQRADKMNLGEELDKWIEHGMSEALEDWYERWLTKFGGGNRLANGSLLVSFAIELVETYKSGFNDGVEELREAINGFGL